MWDPWDNNGAKLPTLHDMNMQRCPANVMHMMYTCTRSSPVLIYKMGKADENSWAGTACFQQTSCMHCIQFAYNHLTLNAFHKYTTPADSNASLLVQYLKCKVSLWYQKTEHLHMYCFHRKQMAGLTQQGNFVVGSITSQHLQDNCTVPQASKWQDILTQEGIFVVNNVSSKQTQASSVVAQWWALEKPLAKLPAMSINPPLQKIHTSVKEKKPLEEGLANFPWYSNSTWKHFLEFHSQEY